MNCNDVTTDEVNETRCILKALFKCFCFPVYSQSILISGINLLLTINIYKIINYNNIIIIIITISYFIVLKV